MIDIFDIEKLVPKGEQIYVYSCIAPPRKTNIIIKPGSSFIEQNSSYYFQTYFFYPRVKKFPNLKKAVKKVDMKKEFNKD